MSACKARVPNKWYHERKYPNTSDHPCQFKAKRDGYCFRHHPEDLKRTLECKRTVLVKKIENVDAAIASIPQIQHLENPS